MSIQHGSFALTRYRIMGSKKHYKYSELNEHLAAFQARPLRLKGVHRPLMAGWVRPVGVDDEGILTDETWDMADTRLDDGYFLRIRIEKRHVPSSLISLVFKKRLESRLKSRKDKVLSRSERKEMLEALKSELMDQCLPQISYVDGYWDEPRQELLIFASARTAVGLFEQLFQKTFAEPLGLALIKVAPPLMGLPEAVWQGDLAAGSMLRKLAETTPTPFAAADVTL